MYKTLYLRRYTPAFCPVNSAGRTRTLCRKLPLYKTDTNVCWSTSLHSESLTKTLWNIENKASCCFVICTGPNIGRGHNISAQELNMPTLTKHYIRLYTETTDDKASTHPKQPRAVLINCFLYSRDKKFDIQQSNESSHNRHKILKKFNQTVWKLLSELSLKMAASISAIYQA